MTAWGLGCYSRRADRDFLCRLHSTLAVSTRPIERTPRFIGGSRHMSLELLGRIHKELAMTGSAVYETVLAISERVNRKVQIIRLHWQASVLLERLDQVTSEVGQQIIGQVSRRVVTGSASQVAPGAVEAVLNRAVIRVQEIKTSLVRIDTRIRDLKLEAIHHDLLSLQRDLSLRSAAIERLVISREAPAAGQCVADLPRFPSIQIAVILRGPCLLAPSAEVIFRPDDIVVVLGLQSELERLTPWFTGAGAMQMALLGKGLTGGG